MAMVLWTIAKPMRRLFIYAAAGVMSVVMPSRCRTWLCAMVVMTIAVGCVTPSAEEQLIARAEVMLKEQPAMALNIMQSIDREALDEECLARYALVYSEANYYNRVLISSDSLTSIAVEHYAQTRCYHEQARAYYQHGLVLELCGQMPEAILAFAAAQEALKSVDDKHLEGVVSRAIGDVYRARYCYNNSYRAYMSAYACFEELGLPYHCYYTKYNLGQVAVKKHEYAEAEALFIEARDYAISTSDHDFLCAVLHELCEIYLQQGMYDRCRETVELFDRYDCVRWFLSRYYAVKAIVTSYDGDNEGALRYISQAEGVEHRDDAIIAEAKYHVYNNMGDLTQALHWLCVINSQLDNKLLVAGEQPVLNYQIDLLESTIAQEERELEILRQRNIAICLFCLFLVVVTILIARSRRRRMQRDIVHYMDTINELQLTRSDNMQPLTEAIDRLYNDRLKDINRLCETYYDHSDTPRQAARVFERVRQTIESLKSDDARLEELESMVNSCRGDLMTRLRISCPKLSERELKVALYSYAGFSSRAICIFVDSNPVALSKIKYRIKTKIKESGCADAELFISAISDH